MTLPERLSSTTFQPLNSDEAAMILGGAATATETFHYKTTTNSDGTQRQDLVADDTIGSAQK